ALQRLSLPWLQHAGVEVAMLRLDRIDSLISGNKWFKLSDHLRQAVTVGAQGVISLGGAHSNHLHALAAAGKRFGFPTVGLLRGHAQQTPTVLDLQAFGMQLHWLGYAGYRARHAADFWQPWQAHYPELYPIAEGGGGLAGALGCARLREMVDSQLGLLAEAGAHPVYGAMAVPDDHGVAENIMAVLGEAAGSQEKASSELPAACVL
ncbi:1-aminocyclopropane-1-carboxylate deaminase, partial [Pseudomonas syringae pv. actinidiae ICMP 19096]